MNTAGSAARMSARQALVEVFGYYKYEVTTFEAQLWARLIDEAGDDAVLGFLQQHVRSSQFAPKLADAQRVLAPAEGNEEAAFLRLVEEVRRVGPWGTPKFEDPAIGHAVLSLGGWAAINEQLPDPSARFDFQAFQERFSVAYQIGRSRTLIHGAPRLELRGLHALSLERPAVPAVAVSQPRASLHGEGAPGGVL